MTVPWEGLVVESALFHWFRLGLWESVDEAKCFLVQYQRETFASAAVVRVLRDEDVLMLAKVLLLFVALLHNRCPPVRILFDGARVLGLSCCCLLAEDHDMNPKLMSKLLNRVRDSSQLSFASITFDALTSD